MTFSTAARVMGVLVRKRLFNNGAAPVAVVSATADKPGRSHR